MMVIVILVNVGMWFERFVITVTSLTGIFYRQAGHIIDQHF